MSLTRGRVFLYVFDAASGVPVSGAHVHVYRHLTTTAISDTMYDAKTGGVTVTNPLTTTSDGLAEAWVGMPGTDVPDYVTLAWDDNTGAAVPPGNSGSVTFRVEYAPADVLSGPATSYNVVALGATGDGVTDDTDAFQAAGVLAKANHGEIYAPRGDYVVAGRVFNLDDNEFVRVRGDGKGLTNIIVGDDGGGNAMFEALGRSAGNNQRAHMILEDCTFKQDTRNFTMDIIDAWQVENMQVRRCEFVNIVGSAIKLTGACDNFTIEGNSFSGCGDTTLGAATIALIQNDEGGTLVGFPQFGRIINNSFEDNDDMVIFGVNIDKTAIIANTIQDNGDNRSLISLIDPTNCKVIGNDLKTATDDCVQIRSTGDSANCTFLGNTFDKAQGNTPGTGYGINFVSENAYHVHAGHIVTANQFGPENDNDAGSVYWNSYTVNSVLGSSNVTNDTSPQYTQSQRPNNGVVTHTVNASDTYVPDLSKGDTFKITENGSFTMAAPINAVAGDELWFILARSAAILPVTTWNAVFHLAAAWVNASSNNNKRTIHWKYDGSVWYEMGRGTGDES